MPADLLIPLTAGIFLIALLYSCVGHAGASGYIALMSLLSMAPADIKPTALGLNILVASIGSFQFWRAGHFSWPLLWPFALLAVPFAWIGGYVDLPKQAFQILVGLTLLYSAARFVRNPPAEREPQQAPLLAALGIGAGVGLLAGLTGTGGGIFLTPILILFGWANARRAAAASAVFILLNSISGLLGNVSGSGTFPPFALPLLVAAGSGGAIGSYLGSQRFDPALIKRLLAAVLAVAGLKLLFT